MDDPPVRLEPRAYQREELKRIEALATRMKEIITELRGERPADTAVSVPEWYAAACNSPSMWFWDHEAAAQYAQVLHQYNIPCQIFAPTSKES